MESPLMSAVRDKNLEKLKKLVEVDGHDIHWENDSAFRYACSLGEIEIVKYLVEKGAFIHIENDDGFSWATQSGNLELVKYLLSIGDFPKKSIEYSLKLCKQDENRKKSLEVIKYLENLPIMKPQQKKEEEEEDEYEEEEYNNFAPGAGYGPQPKNQQTQKFKIKLPPTLTGFDLHDAFLETLQRNNINSKYTSGTFGQYSTENIFIMERETEHLIRDAAEQFAEAIDSKFKTSECEVRFKNDEIRQELHILFEIAQKMKQQKGKKVKSKFFKLTGGKLVLNANELCKSLYQLCGFKMSHFITSNQTLKATFNYEGNYPKHIWNGEKGVRKFIYDNVPYILHLEIDEDDEEDNDGTLVIWFQLIDSLQTID